MKLLNPLPRLRPLFQKHYHYSNPTNSMRVIKLTYQLVSETTSIFTPTPSQQQKPTHHSMRNECLQSSDKDICHDQKTEQIQNLQYAPKQELKQIANRSQTQTRFIGNLNDNTTEDDLYELIGLRSTKYLKQNCSVNKFSKFKSMPTNSNIRKKKYFACHCT